MNEHEFTDPVCDMEAIFGKPVGLHAASWSSNASVAKYIVNLTRL